MKSSAISGYLRLVSILAVVILAASLLSWFHSGA
jgi:hypothetical protein